MTASTKTKKENRQVKNLAVPYPNKWTQIRVRNDTKFNLISLKGALQLLTFDELINKLISSYNIEALENKLELEAERRTK
jgi:hypothetical protein